MSRDAIEDALKTAGHGKLWMALQPLIRPAVYLGATRLCAPPLAVTGKKLKNNAGPKAFAAAMKKLKLGASRFGGLPDLPPGVAWPAREDVPMEFLAQIRLAEIAPHDAEDALPHRGTLLFFFDSEWPEFPEGGSAESCRVLFHDGPDEELVRTSPPTIEWQSEYEDAPRPTPYVHGLATLAFSRIEMPPGGVSPFIAEGSELGAIWQDFDAENSQAWYPAPEGTTHADNHLLGYVSVQDEEGMHANGTEDRCLLQLDSDPASSFMWGKEQLLFFLLTRAELAARDFSKVRVCPSSS